ncbi:carboxypeptidase-like regulatory domain-containing protein, partial [Mycobacterium sp.]|uniref:carboxypeptidase-like regulatory domain-containing protein n=1 Tax=Mycobacterium sp. TaxID=1785 RepID=UPI003BAFEB03
PPQLYDHMVLFVEDDGQTVRHCTASDDRIQNKRYYNGTVKVTTPFGDVEERLPLQGIRGDILAYAWPGSITQTLGEVSQTGRNTANAQFSYETFYPKVIAAEGPTKVPLWQMEPAERDKRTSYHDPEATQSAINDNDRSQRAWHPQTRLQAEPAWRTKQNQWIWPVLVKPHPMLDAAVRDALHVVADAAKDIQAHYRFYGYSQAAIADDPNFNAPPDSGWAAGTIAGVCSSFIWAAVQNANDKLRLAGKPVIELEGEPDPGDGRPPAEKDGIYHYTEDERREAAKALRKHTYDLVADQVQAKIDDLPGIVKAILNILPGDTADAAKDALATIVANQLCNIFAFDHTADFAETWTTPGTGAAVSPDDTQLRWDVNADPNTLPPSRAGKITVYGTYTPVAVSKGGWVAEPIIKIHPTLGQGNLSGRVFKRDTPAAPLQPVVGATVRFGCQVTTSSVIAEQRGVYRFANVAAGNYLLQASMFVKDPTAGTAVEWKSEPRLVSLNAGDNIEDLDLELQPPPGLARHIKIDSHFDIVDKVVVGDDRWGHFNPTAELDLAWDPRDDPALPADQRNTKLDGSIPPMVTPEVGSGVHVRVEVKGKLKQTNMAGTPYDGTVVVDTTLTFYDSGEGEVNAVVSDPGRELATGQSYEMPIHLESDDTVPERASGWVRITNIFAALP